MLEDIRNKTIDFVIRINALVGVFVIINMIILCARTLMALLLSVIH